MTEKIYWRCGACGDLHRYDGQSISPEEWEFGILDDDHDISYCGCQEQDLNRMQVTRDMAIDAGDLSLEGQYI